MFHLGLKFNQNNRILDVALADVKKCIYLCGAK